MMMLDNPNTGYTFDTSIGYNNLVIGEVKSGIQLRR